MSFFSSIFRRKPRIYCDKTSSCAKKAMSLQGHAFAEEEKEAKLLWVRKGFGRRMGKLLPFQLINHFPSQSVIINKGYLTETLKAFDWSAHPELLPISDFYNDSYCLYKPDERKEFFSQLPAVDQRDNLWIYKPGNNSRGRGIEIMWRFSKLRRAYKKWGNRPIVDKEDQGIIQRYISKPLLLEGRKSEIRVYWVVASVDPLIVLMYPEATVRLNSLPYQLDNFDNQLIHVTNVYQQKHHPDYDPNVVLKWRFDQLGSYICKELGLVGPNFIAEELVPRIRRIIASVAIAAKEGLKKDYPAQGDCFAVYGADIIIDDQLNPWLSEVQKGPGLSFDDPVKRDVIPPMLGEATRIALEIRERREKGKSMNDLKSVDRYEWVVNELQPEKVQFPESRFYARAAEGEPSTPEAGLVSASS